MKERIPSSQRKENKRNGTFSERNEKKTRKESFHEYEKWWTKRKPTMKKGTIS